MALIFNVYGKQYTGPLGPYDPKDSRVLGVSVVKMLCERVRGRQKKVKGDECRWKETSLVCCQYNRQMMYGSTAYLKPICFY